MVSSNFSFRWKIFTVISLIFNSVFLYNMLAPQEVGRLGGEERMMYQIHEDIYNLKSKNEALKKTIKIYKQKELR
jgi:hypothetical protein